MNGTLHDVELMDYLINPEKSHKIDVLSRTILGVGIEDDTVGTGEKTELSLFDDAAGTTERIVRERPQSALRLLLRCGRTLRNSDCRSSMTTLRSL